MIVVDASALVDVVTDQRTKAWVLDHLEDRLIAPSHQLAEVLSAINRLVRAGVILEADGRNALADAAALRQEMVLVSGDHMRRAYDLRDRVRVLDGLYVALAEERGATLLTTDGRLSRADLPVPVIAPP